MGKDLKFGGIIKAKLGTEVEEKGVYFNESVWNGIYSDVEKYFPDLSVVGWFAAIPEVTPERMMKLKKIHLDNFAGTMKTFYLIDTVEKEENFYLYENGELKKQKGYEGHYFWDTEMYVLPVLIYTEPEVAKTLLDYRYYTLDQARDRARVLGHDKGALFPWRTINGQEASTYYPLGTAQYHINADIAYALSLYLQVTGDIEYLVEKGAEILIETARVWADVGSFSECKNGKYCICDVTGPDEYNVLVD